jgi:hypothetical protein
VIAAAPARFPSSASRSARRLGLVALFLGAAAISASIMLKGMQPNDEGLMLTAASRIARGEVPYRDFWWFYPPGQPYLLAALWKIFGPSLLTWRIVRVLTNAGVALLVYLLARREAPRGLAIAAWAVAALVLAAPTGPHPYPTALLLSIGALLVMERSPVAAGLLVGLCAVFRIEFAAYLGLGVVLAYLISPEGGVRLAARFVAASVGSALVLFAPVVLPAGIGRSWDLLIRYPIEDFTKYQSLPFPLLYHGPIHFSSLTAARNTIGSVLSSEVPLLMVIDLAAVLAVLALGFKRERWPHVAVAVFGVGMAHYLVTRPDAFHVSPLAVVLAAPSAWILARLGPLIRGPGSIRERIGSLAPRARLALVPLPLIAVVLLWLGLDAAQRAERQFESDMVPIHLAVADGVKELPIYNCSLPGSNPVQVCRLSDLEAAVHYVQRRVPPGKPIYVGTRRADLVTSGAPILYVLTNRPSATRYDIAAPGVVTSAPVQREIVSDLKRKHLPLVIRWTASITAAPEPNRAGKSTGVRILDRFLASHYRKSASFGPYLVLEGRS